jgi:DNA-binding transcriptional ArsR family regulator
LCKYLGVNNQQANALAHIFAALADPTRVQLVAQLAHREASVKELSEPFNISQQAVSRHLKVLQEVGLVTRRKEAQSRPARLEVDRLVDVLAWVDAQRREWVDRHERLDDHLRRQTTEQS